MMQALYSVLAIMLLGVAFLNVNQRVHGTAERMAFTELTIGMTAVGAELLNQVAQYPYDPVALPTTTPEVVTDRELLADENTFGAGGCDPNGAFAGCLFINDFHGKTAARTIVRRFRGVDYDVTYNATYEVRYVTEDAPHTPAGARTFAKEVAVTITSPGLEMADGQPLSVRMARVITYPAL